MSGGRKLVVEITSARDLMPKDGQGSSNAYCVVRFTASRLLRHSMIASHLNGFDVRNVFGTV